MKINDDVLLMGLGIGALLLVGWYMKTKLSDAFDVLTDPEEIRQLAMNGAGAAVGMADGVISGTVIGIGKGVGIPETNMSECEKAKAEGRTWDASFACPASDFIKYVWE